MTDSTQDPLSGLLRRGQTAAKPLPPFEDVADALTYDETSPSCLRWMILNRRQDPDDIAGYRMSSGYWSVGLNRRKLMAHRIVWMLCTGSDPYPYDIDHIHGMGNQISNLRLVTVSGNMGNQIPNFGRADDDAPKFKGVHRQRRSKRNPWVAVCRGRYLGCFPEAVDAARAYNRAALSEWGEYARLNSIIWPGHTWSALDFETQEPDIL